jgi:hypothetical protein
MKSNSEMFSEKMSSSLRAQILAAADIPLEQNFKAHRQSKLAWIWGTGLAAATASISFFMVRQNNQAEHLLQLELAQSVELFEDIQSDDDFEMLADMDLIENLDEIDEIDKS